MPIKGLVDKKRVHTVQNVEKIIGYLNKGYLDTSNPKPKPVELPYFRFTPNLDNDDDNKRLLELFNDIYTDRPYIIDDVRFPHALAGNFDFHQQVWLKASMYQNRRGDGKDTLPLAFSDGETIVRMRVNGRMTRVSKPHAEYTVNDDSGKLEWGSFKYKNKLYPWVQELTLDLVLPDLNQAMVDNCMRTYGIVRMYTHSKWDIAGIHDSFFESLRTMAGMWMTSSGKMLDDIDFYINRLPLEQIPFTLYRHKRRIPVPAFGKDASPDDRMFTEKWLVGLQINAEYKRMLDDAKMESVTKYLTSGNGGQLALQQENVVEEVNELFFNDGDGDTARPIVGDAVEPDDTTSDEIDPDVIHPAADVKNTTELFQRLSENEHELFGSVRAVANVVSTAGFVASGDYERDYDDIIALVLEEPAF